MMLKFREWEPSPAEWERGCARRLPVKFNLDCVLVHRPGEGYFIREAYNHADQPMPYTAGPFETEEAAMAAVQLMTS